MPLPEILYRTRQAASMLCLKVSGVKVSVPPIDEGRLKSLALPLIHGRITHGEIERIINNTCSAHIRDQRRKSVSEKSRSWPRVAGKLRYILQCSAPSHAGRDDSGDIRSIWEPARLQDIYKLLVFATENPSHQYSAVAKAYARQKILAWIRENPILTGPHYLSVMECGLRIPVFLYTLSSLGCLSDREKQLIGGAIYQHAWLISRRMSLYSSLGNHTICECAGLVFAGGLFRGDKEGQRWLKRGTQLLDREIRRQILEDGGPLEQSLAYHRIVLDLCWMTVRFLEQNGFYDCSHWKDRLMKGDEFLGVFADKQGGLPFIGDSDDGAAVAPGLAPERPFMKTRTDTSPTFTCSGYTIIARPEDARLIFDHGPLGMAPLYNHGHADALSIILYKNGRPLLVDPGTFRYNGSALWRMYFKSTRAHNTVTIDGLDQADQETGFIWSSPYTVHVCGMNKTPDGLSIQACHSGYSRLAEPVLHSRKIEVRDRRYTITDTFSGRGVHDFELNFHLHPDASATQEGNSWIIRNNDAECTISLANMRELALIRGRTDPPMGWFSPAYGQKTEAFVLSCRETGRPEEVSFETVISV